MVLARLVLQHKAAGEALKVERVRDRGGTRLAVLVLGLGASDVLDLRQRQQVAVLGGVQDIGCSDDQPLVRPQRGQFDGADVVAVDGDGDRPVLQQHS